MMKFDIRGTLSAFFASLMLISTVFGVAFAFSSNQPVSSYSSDYELSRMNNVSLNAKLKSSKQCSESEERISYKDDDIVTIIVALNENALLETSGAVKKLDNGSRTLTDKGNFIKANMLKKQDKIIETIELNTNIYIETLYNYTIGFNGFAIEAPYKCLEMIKSIDGVKSAEISPEFDIPNTDYNEGLTTQMFSADEMVGAYSAWNNGYDGSGTLVAVIDTGLYTDHEAFQTAPDTLKYNLSDLQKIFADNNLQAEKRFKDLTAEQTYIRDKIPFAFDYANKDCDVNHGREATSNDHGTHVAGIIAADSQIKSDMEGAKDVQIKGVAPKAQLAIMKVFGDNGGGTQWSTIVAAMEDCIYLGADSVNISIGEVSSFPTMDDEYSHMFELMHDAGINVSVAAGNYYSSGFSGTWNTSMQTTLNLENSMLTTPSIYRSVLSVASVNNTKAIYSNYIGVDGNQLLYYDSAADIGERPDLLFSKCFGGQTLDYLVLGGLGYAKDYDGIDVTGKIVVVERGGMIFPEKQVNAYNAGALGLIVYDSVVQAGMVQMQIQDFKFPTIYMPRLNGLKLLEAADENGLGKLFVSDGNSAIIESGNGAEPSDFSSWGPLSNLEIKPELSAPGGNIVSTVDYYLGGRQQSNYASYSGTSMSTPNVSGCMAVIRQRVNELFPDMSAKEKVNLVYALAMTTATPAQKNGTPYGVRKQGAGIINVGNAIATNAYISVEGNDHPKIELFDDPEKSGIYKLEFTVNNFGNDELTYEISPCLTVPGFKEIDQGYRKTYVQTDYNFDCTNMMSFTTNMPDNKVTVSGGSSKIVNATIKVNDDFRSLMDEVFKYGSFVEGYCTLKSVASQEGAIAPNLSVCYLGYYGSWSESPVIESGFYFDEDSNNLSSMSNPNTAGSKINTTSYLELGMNPYFDEADNFSFLADRSSISPLNKDSRYDAVDYYLTGVVRNLSKFYYKIYDPNTGEIYFEKTNEGNISKNDDRLFSGSINPMGTSINKIKAWKGVNQSEGQTLIIRCGGEGIANNWDESRAKMAYWEMPVTLDNAAPYVKSYYSEGNYLYVTISDAHYAAYAGVFDNSIDTDGNNPFAEFCIAENTRGADTTVKIDMTNRNTAYLLLGDYACNEAQYEIKHTGNADTPTPTPNSKLQNAIYQQTSTLIEKEIYLITIETNDGHRALSGVLSTDKNGLQGAKVTVDNVDATDYIASYSAPTVEWTYLEDGTLKNTNGKFLILDDNHLSLGDIGLQWRYEGNRLLSDTNYIYYDDCFIASSVGSRIKLFRKTNHTYDNPANLSTSVRQNGNELCVDINLISKNEIGNGVITLIFDDKCVSYKDIILGDMLLNSSIIDNAEIKGKVKIGFASTEAIDADGRVLLSVRFSINSNVPKGTLLIFELVADELNNTDSTAFVKADAIGTQYIVEEFNSTPIPTYEPTPTPTPSTKPSVKPTESPSEVPTSQPIPPVPGETGENISIVSLCLAICGVSGVCYTILRRKNNS